MVALKKPGDKVRSHNPVDIKDKSVLGTVTRVGGQLGVSKDWPIEVMKDYDWDVGLYMAEELELLE